ncbi:DUF924 domain-containing protein [Trinickia sp. LjRoot230]|uniref:DUF924 family protein n=1 Tax=Trinickia sp. LjRoot230 TaxID=3342288 RepID=UPI003ECDAACC
MTTSTNEGTTPHPERTTAAADDYATLEPSAQAVLAFWFGEPGSPRFGQEWDRWFARDDAFDATLREQFGATLAGASGGECDSWQRSPLGTLALIIVLDQFSRNIHRGTLAAFAADGRALAVARGLIASGADLTLPSLHHRAFAYLPFEHAESREAQSESVRLFSELARETGEQGYLRYARQHAVIIERFGRFPHRNAVLGRVSTEEELAFLREPGSSF